MLCSGYPIKHRYDADCGTCCVFNDECKQKDMQCSEDLQRQVLGYYEYLWIRRQGGNLSDIYHLLPTVFQAEITLATYLSLIEKVNSCGTACDTSRTWLHGCCTYTHNH